MRNAMLPDRYTVGADGRVWIEQGEDFRLCHVDYNRDGYARIQVGNYKSPGGRKRYFIHHLVMHYHGPPRPGPEYEIGHRDGNKANNGLANLYWCTRSQNIADVHRHRRERERRVA